MFRHRNITAVQTSSRVVLPTPRRHHTVCVSSRQTSDACLLPDRSMNNPLLQHQVSPRCLWTKTACDTADSKEEQPYGAAGPSSAPWRWYSPASARRYRSALSRTQALARARRRVERKACTTRPAASYALSAAIDKMSRSSASTTSRLYRSVSSAHPVHALEVQPRHPPADALHLGRRQRQHVREAVPAGGQEPSGGNLRMTSRETAGAAGHLRELMIITVDAAARANIVGIALHPSSRSTRHGGPCPVPHMKVTQSRCTTTWMVSALKTTPRPSPLACTRSAHPRSSPNAKPSSPLSLQRIQQQRWKGRSRYGTNNRSCGRCSPRRPPPVGGGGWRSPGSGPPGAGPSCQLSPRGRRRPRTRSAGVVAARSDGRLRASRPAGRHAAGGLDGERFKAAWMEGGK
jgi:hypothetical protein